MIPLGPGLTAITGESGAGKSVLVECLGQLLGAPPPPDCVRGGAEVALVEGKINLAGGQLQEQVGTEGGRAGGGELEEGLWAGC